MAKLKTERLSNVTIAVLFSILAQSCIFKNSSEPKQMLEDYVVCLSQRQLRSIHLL